MKASSSGRYARPSRASSGHYPARRLVHCGYTEMFRQRSVRQTSAAHLRLRHIARHCRRRDIRRALRQTEPGSDMQAGANPIERSQSHTSKPMRPRQLAQVVKKLLALKRYQRYRDQNAAQNPVPLTALLITKDWSRPKFAASWS